MSRSALEKQFLRQRQREVQAQLQVVNTQHTLAYVSQQQQYAANQQYGTYQMYYPQQQAMHGGIPTNPLSMVSYIPVTAMDPYNPTVASYPSTAIEQPEDNSNILPMHGNSTNFNINALLYNNIMESDYFKALYQLRTYHEVLGEIQQSVHHVEPWTTGTARYPSTAFCLLLKFMLMRLTVKQMNGLLEAEGSPFSRAIGFLYLRYTCPPNELWKWFEPFLEDEEIFQPFSDKTISMTMGSYCIKLLTEMSYSGTTLPRIPVPIERKMKVLLLLLEDKKKRHQRNLRLKEQGHFKVGDKVRAIYGDEENEPAWYDAVIDSFDDENDFKYWVTFPEYGNLECVDLGDMDIIDNNSSIQTKKQDDQIGHSNVVSRSRSRSCGRDNSLGDRDAKRRRTSRSRSKERRPARRSHSRSSSPRRIEPSSSSSNLLAKVLQSERDASAAVGKHYASRPATYKDSLSLKFDTYTAARRRSPSPHQRNRDRDRDRHVRRSRTPSPKRDSVSTRAHEPSEEQLKRLKTLKDKYGDASTKHD
jgi:pre-mRNA-splicing factor 38B